LAFPNLESAKADAVEQGFTYDTDRWIVTIDGRTTHYRPGHAPINLMTGEAPPE
jgi:hypothetical protein